jgi:hypothetical protein
MNDLAIQSHPFGGDYAETVNAAVSNSSDGGEFLETLLDIVNPLQHLPVISTVYRALTGDAISAPARLVGGVLFGGLLGGASAAINLAVEEITGSDIGEHALALLADDDTAGDQLAALDADSAAASRTMQTSPDERQSGTVTLDSIAWNSDRFIPLTLALQQQPAPGTGTERTTPAASGGDRAAARLPAAPIWLSAALAEAEQAHAATTASRAPASRASTEWVSTAMSHALDKYQAMAIARSQKAELVAPQARSTNIGN